MCKTYQRQPTGEDHRILAKAEPFQDLYKNSSNSKSNT